MSTDLKSLNDETLIELTSLAKAMICAAPALGIVFLFLIASLGVFMNIDFIYPFLTLYVILSLLIPPLVMRSQKVILHSSGIIKYTLFSSKEYPWQSIKNLDFEQGSKGGVYLTATVTNDTGKSKNINIATEFSNLKPTEAKSVVERYMEKYG